MNSKLNRSLTAFVSSSLALLAIAILASPPPAGPASQAEPLVALATPAGEAPSGERLRAPANHRQELAMPYFSFARGVRRIGG